jgi:arsenate reductase-like glutaredoxin family protein
VTDAKKARFGPVEALALARKARRVVAARGKKVVTIDINKDKPDDEALLAVLLGPSGNLRAPAAIVGTTLVVGFNPDVYRDVLDV